MTLTASINKTNEVFFNTGPKDQEPFHNSLVVLVVELTMAVFGVLLNFTVLLTITCTKHVQGSNTTKFIISLAVSDLLVCSFVMTLNALLQVGKLKQVASTLPLNIICYGMDSFNVIALTSSSFTVLGIAVDRYMCVANPVYYYSNISNTKIAMALASVWMFSTVLGVVPFLIGSVRLYKPGICSMDITPNYQLSIIVIVIFIPCFIICIVYSSIFLSAYEHIKTSKYRRASAAVESSATTSTTFIDQEKNGTDFQKSTHTKSTHTKSTHTKSTPSSKSSGRFNLDFTAHVNFIEEAEIEDGNIFSRRVRQSLKSNFMQHIGASRTYATVTMCLVVGVFVIHWLPFGVVNLVDAFQPNLIPNYIERGFMWLLLMNSCWNPIIYAFSNQLVRKDLIRVFTCQCSRSSYRASTAQRFNYLQQGQAPRSKTSLMFSGLEKTPSHSIVSRTFPAPVPVEHTETEESLVETAV